MTGSTSSFLSVPFQSIFCVGEKKKLTAFCSILHFKIYGKWLFYLLCSLWFINNFLNMYLATSIPGVIGSWSTEGCKVNQTQKYKGFITCECNHLTNFALLLDVSQTRYRSQALSIITWIGCGISMVGLALTIITFLYLK